MKNHKIRLAFCLRDMKVGGVESVLLRTLERLSQCRDLDITLVTYTPIRDMWKDWFCEHKNISVRTLYPWRFLGTDLPHFFLWRLIKHGMRDIYRWSRFVLFNNFMFRDFDVVVDYYDFNYSREFAKLNIPKIAWWHSSSNKFYHGHYVNHLKNYDKLVVLTDAFAEELGLRYPNYANKITRIYNPIDVNSVQLHANDAPVRQGDYFAVVARLVNGKDIETVLLAFDMFRAKNNNPDVHLVIVGDGYKTNYFKSVARKCASADNIDFMGSMKNPMGIMRGAMANILSSFGEGLPTVLIEAAALGTLNIASDCPNGPREILMNGRAGLLFNVGNVDSLADCMDSVYNKKVAIKKMVNVATANMSRFDIDTIAEDIHNLVRTFV